jgi:hypothetical protein
VTAVDTLTTGPGGKMAGVAGIGVDAFRTGGERVHFSSTVKRLGDRLAAAIRRDFRLGVSPT